MNSTGKISKANDVYLIVERKRLKSINRGIIILSLMLLICQGWQDCLLGRQKEPGKSQVDSTLASALQTALDEGVSALSLMGVSAAVTISGQGEWQGVSGMSDPVAGDSVHPEMVFAAGSITKNFVAALLLDLAEDGLLTLEDSVGQWLPAYPNIDGSITIRQLLNHSSGIFNYEEHPDFEAAMLTDLSRQWAPEELISTFVNAPYFPAGTSMAYSNTNYILLGMIVQQVTGTAVSAELRNRFFDPLGLNSTFFEVEEIVSGEVAHGWEDIDGNGVLDDIFPFPRTAIWSAAGAAGAIFSTAEDIAHWGTALFDGQILTQASLAEMIDFLIIFAMIMDFPFCIHGHTMVFPIQLQ